MPEPDPNHKVSKESLVQMLEDLDALRGLVGEIGSGTIPLALSNPLPLSCGFHERSQDGPGINIERQCPPYSTVRRAFLTLNYIEYNRRTFESFSTNARICVRLRLLPAESRHERL